MDNHTQQLGSAPTMGVIAGFDDSTIVRWAKLFASRFQMPDRTDEFTSRIVGAILEEPRFARREINGDCDIAALFEHARRTIEECLGTSIISVPAAATSGLRESLRAERLARLDREGLPAVPYALV